MANQKVFMIIESYGVKLAEYSNSTFRSSKNRKNYKKLKDKIWLIIRHQDLLEQELLDVAVLRYRTLPIVLLKTEFNKICEGCNPTTAK